MDKPDQGSGPDGDKPAAPSETVLQTIWFALLATLGVYAVIGIVVVKPGAATMPPDQMTIFGALFAMLAIVETGFAMAAPRFLTTLPPASLHILRWALAESIGIYGLLIRFLGGPVTWFYVFLGWSALLMITLRPGQQEQK